MMTREQAVAIANRYLKNAVAGDKGQGRDGIRGEWADNNFIQGWVIGAILETSHTAEVTAAMSRNAAPPTWHIDPTKAGDLRYIQRINHEVANHLFPDRTDATMFMKLYSEVAEIVDRPGEGSEVADVLIMVLDHASRHGIDAGVEVLLKLGVNLGREWETNPVTGVSQHKE